jgi:transposase
MARGSRLSDAHVPIVFQEYVRAVTEPTARLQRLAQARHARVTTWPPSPSGRGPPGVTGVQCTVAVTTVAERGDLTRITNSQQRMRDRGLTPSAYASGPWYSQGGITKTGHSHACQALVEGAWAYRDPAQVSRHLQRRLEQRPTPSRTSVGRRRSAWVHSLDHVWLAASTPIKLWRRWREHWWP